MSWCFRLELEVRLPAAQIAANYPGSTFQFCTFLSGLIISFGQLWACQISLSFFPLKALQDHSHFPILHLSQLPYHSFFWQLHSILPTLSLSNCTFTFFLFPVSFTSSLSLSILHLPIAEIIFFWQLYSFLTNSELAFHFYFLISNLYLISISQSCLFASHIYFRITGYFQPQENWPSRACSSEMIYCCCCWLWTGCIPVKGRVSPQS